jgi:hypothetical protein
LRHAASIEDLGYARIRLEEGKTIYEITEEGRAHLGKAQPLIDDICFFGVLVIESGADSAADRASDPWYGKDVPALAIDSPCFSFIHSLFDRNVRPLSAHYGGFIGVQRIARVWLEELTKLVRVKS